MGSEASTEAKAKSPSKEAPEARALGAYEALSRSAKLPDLVALTLEIAELATSTRLAETGAASKVQAYMELAKLAREDAETPYGNALKVLETGPEDAAERALAQALYAHAVAEMPRGKAEAETKLAGDILWLATHTAFDATPLLDRALGEDAVDIWRAVADRILRIDEGRGGALGRGEALVGCASLSSAESEGATAARDMLVGHLHDPVLARILGDATPKAGVRLLGETVPPPRGPVATTLLAVTGILFLLRLGALVGRVALAYRRDAEVDLSPKQIRVRTRTTMLGRTLGDREQVIDPTSLARVVREVRYPRSTFYAGLLALALGSFLGVRALVDGVRAASPSLLVVGIVVLAAGVALDFALGTLIPGSKGQCRIGFVPKTGTPVWVGRVDATRADEALASTLGSSAPR